MFDDPRANIPNLSPRERQILSAVVQHFILTATPAGSRQLSRRLGIDLSAATVRNVMADLEEMGLLCHPHTSAGRVPSDLGYRLYVNDLMETCVLTTAEKEAIEREFEGISQELDEIMAVTARVLSSASRLLAIVMVPTLDDARLHRVDLVRVSQSRLLVVISLESGPVKTIMVELEQSIPEEQLQQISHVINHRLSGLTLAQVRAEIGERFANLPATHPGLVRFFIDSAERLFSFSDRDEMKIGGRAEVLSQPEFSDPLSMRGIIELIEDKDIIVHLLQDQKSEDRVAISIGSENPDARAKGLSVLASSYYSPSASGKVGVIGPTRMDYSKLKSLVEFTARIIQRHMESGSQVKRKR
ncbi:heat-inducible transcription repressor HrcA [candidate division KSB1 bacterium]|nr:MAG: heat-inducible transcription repressor HrcA [candidate division KSB1 bacterium]